MLSPGFYLTSLFFPRLSWVRPGLMQDLPEKTNRNCWSHRVCHIKPKRFLLPAGCREAANWRY